jgi:hypothetical protein
MPAFPQQNPTSRSVSDTDAEICLNTWFLVDDTGMVIRIAAKAYSLTGSDEQKLTVLKSLAGTDPVGQQLEPRLDSGLESGLESILHRTLQALASLPLSKSQIASAIGQQTASGTLHTRIRQMLAAALIERTLPEKPNSRLQKYRLTAKGRALIH